MNLNMNMTMGNPANLLFDIWFALDEGVRLEVEDAVRPGYQPRVENQVKVEIYRALLDRFFRNFENLES